MQLLLQLHHKDQQFLFFFHSENMMDQLNLGILSFFQKPDIQKSCYRTILTVTHITITYREKGYKYQVSSEAIEFIIQKTYITLVAGEFFEEANFFEDFHQGFEFPALSSRSFNALLLIEKYIQFIGQKDKFSNPYYKVFKNFRNTIIGNDLSNLIPKQTIFSNDQIINFVMSK